MHIVNAWRLTYDSMTWMHNPSMYHSIQGLYIYIYIVLTLVLRSSEHNTYYLIFFYVAGYYLIRIENSRVLPYMESTYHPSPLYGAYHACVTGTRMTDKRVLVVTRHDVSMMATLKM